MELKDFVVMYGLVYVVGVATLLFLYPVFRGFLEEPGDELNWRLVVLMVIIWPASLFALGVVMCFDIIGWIFNWTYDKFYSFGCWLKPNKVKNYDHLTKL